MAYRRRRNRKRGYRRKRKRNVRMFPASSGVVSTYNGGLRKRRINFRQFLAAHQGHFEVTLSAQTISDTWGYYGLTTIRQGDGDANRDGDQVQLTKMTFIMHIHPGVTYATLTKASMWARVVIFVDKSSVGGTAPGATVLFSNPTAGTSVTSTYQPDNVPSRFIILYDQMVELGKNESGKTLRATLNLSKIGPTTFNSDVGNPTDYASNSLWMAVCGSENTATDTMNFNMTRHIQFTK